MYPHSRKKDKDIDTFNSAVKEKLARKDYEFWEVFFPVPFPLHLLDGLKFDKPVIFGDAYFSKADFDEVEFNDVDFSGAFLVEADFSKCHLFGKSKFSKCYLLGEALFLGATFREADFFEASFEEVNFHWATMQKADFSKSAFQYSIFSFANIIERVTFVGVRARKTPNENQHWEGDLQFIRFGEKGVIRFVNLSLAHVEFSGTDLRRVEFDRVTWASWWGRTAAYDEILLHKKRWSHIAYVLKYGGLWGRRKTGEGWEDRPVKPSYKDFAIVESLYRQLKTNYEEERDFKRVGDFHYGEMEMHRRGSFWRQWLPSWYNFYRVLSGYGERPLRAFIWLLLLIPAWAGLVWGLGFNQASPQASINYGNTLFFILEKALLQRPEWLSGISWLGKLLGSLSVLLLPGQAALFILALRNRLGRRR